MKYCTFPKTSGWFCEKCKDFKGGSNCKCAKCNECCAASLWELEKEHPQFKTLLEKWKDNNGGYSATWICSQCWKKDIVGGYEKNKPVSSCNKCCELPTTYRSGGFWWFN